MNTNQRKVMAGWLGWAALLVSPLASADDDLDICRAGYKSLLMTPVECRAYLKELRAAQSRGDHMAVLDLQEWHTSLLIERSQACPCWTKPAAMRGARQVSSRPQQPAPSFKY